MTTVLDASVVAAWALPDESRSAAAAGLARELVRELTLVPGIFWYEIRNVLLRAERQGRIVQADVDRFLAQIGSVVQIDGDHDEAHLLRLARQHGLSAYDAAYLETVLRRRADLATFDRALSAASRAEGVRNPAEDALGRAI